MFQWELTRRKELGEEAERREQERDGLEMGIRLKEEKLRELVPQLAAVLESSKYGRLASGLLPPATPLFS